MNISLDQEYLSPLQVQKCFSISRATFYRLLSSGKIEAIKVGKKSTRVPASSIRAYFESCPKYKGGAVIEQK